MDIRCFVACIMLSVISNFQMEILGKGHCYTFKKVTSGLGMPLAIEFPKSGSFRNRAVVAERAGKVHLVNLVSGEKEVLLDLSRIILTSEAIFEERGLLGLALDTNFHDNGMVYVAYSNATQDLTMDHKTIVSRFFTDAPPEQKLSSQEIILEIEQPGPRQNGGQLFFAPDGYLYLATGDSGDYHSRHSLNSLLGKILRIDVSQQSTKYTVPMNNPFVSGKLAGMRTEIFAYGFRNPWRCSVDVVPNDSDASSFAKFRIFCGDVGDSERHEEDIDLIVAGGRYGLTKNHEECSLPTNCQVPIHSYSTNYSQAVIGGIFYRGKLFPFLNNKYLYGDFINGSVHALTESSSGWNKEDICVKFDTDYNCDHDSDKKVFLLGIAANDHGEIFALGFSTMQSEKFEGFIFKLEMAVIPDRKIPYKGSPKYRTSTGIVAITPPMFIYMFLVITCV